MLVQSFFLKHGLKIWVQTRSENDFTLGFLALDLVEVLLRPLQVNLNF